MRRPCPSDWRTLPVDGFRRRRPLVRLPPESRLPLEVLIFRRPEIFPAILLWGFELTVKGGFPGPLVAARQQRPQSAPVFQTGGGG
jgi:hypothetical protein